VLITGEMLIGICSLALQLYRPHSDDTGYDDNTSGNRSNSSTRSSRRMINDNNDE